MKKQNTKHWEEERQNKLFFGEQTSIFREGNIICWENEKRPRLKIKKQKEEQNVGHE